MRPHNARFISLESSCVQISAQVPGVDVQDLFVHSEVLGIWRGQVVGWVIDDGSCDPQQVCILPCRFCLKRQICEPVSGRHYLWVSAKPDSVPQRVVLLPAHVTQCGLQLVTRFPQTAFCPDFVDSCVAKRRPATRLATSSEASFL